MSVGQTPGKMRTSVWWHQFCLRSNEALDTVSASQKHKIQTQILAGSAEWGPGNYYTGEETKQKLKVWVHANVAIDFQPLTLVSSYWLKLSASLSRPSAASVCTASYFLTFSGIDHLQGKLPTKNSLVGNPVKCNYSSNHYLFIKVSLLKENIFWLKGISKEYY